MTRIREALAALLDEVDGDTCRHETTYRIRQWTLCRECSMAWADDRGGFVPYADSPAVAMARAALAAPEVTPEMVEAGALEMARYDYDSETLMEAAPRVYLAMEAAKATPDAPHPLPEREATLLRDYGE